MFELSRLKKIVPFSVVFLLLSANTKVVAWGKKQSFPLQNKTTPEISNRQVDYKSNLDALGSDTELFLAQVNNVEQLKDIEPTDWSYEALRGLIDRYGCIDGLENRTYRREQTISRFEFVAGLNSCLNEMEKILSNSDRVPQVDVNTVLRLLQEFQSELAILQGRKDGAQAQIEDLEATQFSTTTKLKGEAVLGLGDVLSDDDNTSNVLGSRLRLDLESINGRDFNSTIDNLEVDSQRSLHLEAFYQYQVNDNIAITPGIIWITEPDSNINNSEDLVIGTVRTTFSF